MTIENEARGNQGVQLVWIEKASIHRQRADGSTELLDYLFLAEVVLSNPGAVYDVQVLSDQGLTLARFVSGGRLAFVNEWLLDRQARSFSSLIDLDEGVPNDDYHCKISDANGEHEFCLALGGTERRTRLPAPPAITMRQGGQTTLSVSSSNDIEIAWTPFTPGPAPERNSNMFSEPTIFFLVDNCRGETVFSSGSGARGRPSLPASTCSLVIPAGALEPGLSYTVFLSFIDCRSSAIDSSGLVSGASVNSIMIEMAFQTLGESNDSRSCPPIDVRACYRWPGKLPSSAEGLSAWPVAGSGLTLEPNQELRSASF